MPFDGRVVSTNIDVGQFITIGAPIATVYRTDVVEVMVPLEDAELAWFAVPLNSNHNGDNSYAAVTVFAEFAGAEHTWAGRLVRTEGRIDPKSRMVHVVAQIPDPFKTESGRPPLAPGMFVRVDIQGKEVKDIYCLPRYAIRRGTEVWVATEKLKDAEAPEADVAGEEKTLTFRSVEIVRMDRDFAYISGGLNEGEFVITSALGTVTNGMDIRLHVDDEAEKQ
jgi:multidrug efflux pump subunit AcrA (membrane-fusion protein)